MSTSVEPNNEDSSLRQRRSDKSSVSEKPEEPDTSDLKRTKYDETKEFVESLKKLESILAPILLTLLSFFVRFYRISKNNHVVWDEAHFGKFGSYYLRHEFYHDVHPPLGKMLVGLSGYLAGYNGSWDFPSGEEYPNYVDYTKMRLFNATFSALCVPFAYFTCKEIGFSIYTTWLFSLMVCLESTYVTLGKFILLDSMLLFFTITTFFSFARFNNFNNREQEFGRKWWKWLMLTGLSIGCTCSVKMVGLFVTSLIGLYTVVDLWNKLGDKSISWKKYIFGHWASRIFGLIIIPISVFMLAFKVHFDLLYKSGTGDANMSPLFQANLLGSSVGGGPREVSIVHSSVTIKNQGLSGGLLHSHVQTFPGGSKQQQVTTYGHKDSNNNWVFQRARGLPHYDPSNNNTDIEYVIDGMTIRLMHKNTGRNLHSHEIPAPVTSAQFEVASYGNLTLGDAKDNWIVEIMEQNSNEDKLRLHPLTTSFRLKHAILGCYLATSGSNLPQWGFRQGEVVCQKNPFTKDKRTWWIIEDNQNPILPPPPPDFKLPKTKFIKDFVQLNLAMMATNNALVPDDEKQDDLASEWWQWPILNVGIRMCGWGSANPKYFMIGSPATTWTSTFGVILFALLVIYYVVRWQRQIIDFPVTNPDKLKRFIMGGIYPMFGWGLHYVPFVIMGRVKYVHHYMPALYFAMLVFCYEVDSFTRRLNDKNASVASKLLYGAIYIVLYVLVCGTFYYFRYFSFGMEGPKENWKHLQLLRSWRVSDDKYH